MTKTKIKTGTISAQEMRDRLLAGLERPSQLSDDWIVALGSEKNRELLGLIGRTEPKSIAVLSGLTGRAQPNVSRSLSALVKAGLVRIDQQGRYSVPSLTALGREKAEELALLDVPAPLADERASWVRTHFADTQTPDLFGGCSSLQGSLFVDLWFRGAAQATAGKFKGNLLPPTSQLVQDWWRLFFRRDAPSRLLDVELEGRGHKGAISLRSSGRHLQLIFRGPEGQGLLLAERYARLSLAQTQQEILENWVLAVVNQQRVLKTLDSELQSFVSRILDSMRNAREAVFCRAAGALGVSPYNLEAAQADCIRELITEIEDEDARLDFASSVLWDELRDGLNWAESEVRMRMQRNAFPSLDGMREASKQLTEDRVSRPWKIGRELAIFARKSLGIASDKPVGGMSGLTRLFGAESFDTSRSAAPGDVRGFQSLSSDGPVIVVEEESPSSTTFILARAIGDYLAFGSRSACVANLYTDRQAVGRAFAAEFIAPMEAVGFMVEEGRPSYKIQRHFGASQETIRRQYENFGR